MLSAERYRWAENDELRGRHRRKESVDQPATNPPGPTRDARKLAPGPGPGQRAAASATGGWSTIMGGKIAGLAGKGQLCTAIGQINRPRILRAH